MRALAVSPQAYSTICTLRHMDGLVTSVLSCNQRTWLICLVLFPLCGSVDPSIHQPATLHPACLGGGGVWGFFKKFLPEKPDFTPYLVALFSFGFSELFHCCCLGLPPPPSNLSHPVSSPALDGIPWFLSVTWELQAPELLRPFPPVSVCKIAPSPIFSLTSSCLLITLQIMHIFYNGQNNNSS